VVAALKKERWFTAPDEAATVVGCELRSGGERDITALSMVDRRQYFAMQDFSDASQWQFTARATSRYRDHSCRSKRFTVCRNPQGYRG